MERDYLQEALGTFNIGKHQWYGFKKDWTGDKRMSYENIILNDATATMPSEADVNTKIQEIKDADTNKANNIASAKTKLEALGLTEEEVKETFGI
tara:strand:- start:264 stop:548 length:285 start_codon:yes stop_codon:yes gene_type:complete